MVNYLYDVDMLLLKEKLFFVICCLATEDRLRLKLRLVLSVSSVFFSKFLSIRANYLNCQNDMNRDTYRISLPVS